MAAAQNDADSASLSSPWTNSRLKKYRYSAPATNKSQMAKSEYRTRGPRNIGKRVSRLRDERAAVQSIVVRSRNHAMFELYLGDGEHPAGGPHRDAAGHRCVPCLSGVLVRSPRKPQAGSRRDATAVHAGWRDSEGENAAGDGAQMPALPGATDADARSAAQHAVPILEVPQPSRPVHHLL